MDKLFEDYISECCEETIYGKGTNKGLFCSGCNKEIFSYKDKELV